MMPIDLSFVITIISVAAAVYVGLSTKKRNDKKDFQEEIQQTSMIMSKLEIIGSGVSEIKSDMNSVKKEQRELSDRLLISEQSLKRAWNKLDLIYGIDSSERQKDKKFEEEIY